MKKNIDFVSIYIGFRNKGRPAVSCRRHFEFPFECGTEIGGIAEVQRIGDFLNGSFGFPQEPFCLGETKLYDIMARPDIEPAVPMPEKGAAGKAVFLGNLCHGEIVGKMQLKIGGDFFYSP